MDSTETKLPLREMLAFGCGDFASCLFWATFMRYLPLFYTDVFGITAGALGTMLLVSRVLDGLFDPVVGMYADRTETRWGKFRPFILFGCVPFTIFGVLTFTTPNYDYSGKLIWAYVTYNILMLLYTVVNIPYTSLMGVMTNDPVERTRLSSIKFIFAFSAGVVISACLLPLVAAVGGTSNPQLGWQVAFTLVSMVALGFFLLTFFGTRERIRPAVEPNTSVYRDLSYLFTNRPWLLLVGTTLAWILFIALRASVSAHYFKYYLFNGAPETELAFLGYKFNFITLTSAFNTLNQASSVAGIILIGIIAAKLPKKPLLITLLSVHIICTVAYYFLSPGQLGAIFILEFVGSLIGAPLPVLIWAMYADAADYGEWKSGRRTTGLIFSASTMSQKIGWALGAFIALQLLQHVGFHANQEPSAAVKSSLVLLMSIYPSIFGVISIVVFYFYPLSERRMAEINSDLSARRSQSLVS